MLLGLRSFFFNAALYGCTTLMCLLLMWTLPFPRRYVLRVVHFWLWQVTLIEKYIGGITYHVVGKAHVPKGACIIASKHQSAWETFKLHVLFGDPSIVLKKELLNIPVWGWFLRRSGMIPVDRGGKGKAVSGMILAARKAAKDNRKIVIFPQGTRTAPGAVKPYKTGIAALYHDLDLPIVPMALNSGLFWPKNGFIRKPGVITVEFLAPIPAGLPREVMMKRLQEDLEGASERLAVAGSRETESHQN